ncbi:MAG: phosphotransferase [Hyphomicrobiales bacterium]|nr:phosphotransferase [Hyphomicrobiales bacterium]
MKPAISLVSLETALRRDLGAVAALTPMAEGEDSRAFALGRGGDDFVVRVNRSAEGFEKDALAYRCFATDDLPIPEVISIGALDDENAYCISRRLAGVTLQDLTGSQLPPVLAPVAQVMNAIGDADVTGLTGFGPFDRAGAGRHSSWREFLTSVADPQHHDWNAISNYAAMSQVDRLTNLVSDLAEQCPETRDLVHGDFGSNNVLTDGVGITGVIDWSEALIGDPLYDLANILFWRPWLTCMDEQARYFESQRSDLLRHSDRLRCYQLRIGIEEIYQSAVAGNHRMCDWALARCAEIAE